VNINLFVIIRAIVKQIVYILENQRYKNIFS